MRRTVLSAVILSLLVLPVLSGCETKQLKEENAKIKQQVDALTKDKAGMQTQMSQLTAQMDELKKKNADLEKENADLKAKLAGSKKQPAKPAAKPAPKKK